MSVSEQRYRSRYAAEVPVSDEARSATWAAVNAAMVRLFGPPRNADGFAGGVILRVSNGTPPDPETVNCDGPGMSEAWRRRIAKARKESREWSAEIRVRELAAEITTEQLNNDIEEIRTWANSLRKRTA